MSDKTKVQIIVSGPVGCGKSAIVEEIAVALKAIGIEVSFADPRAVQSERNMVGDHIGSLEIYRKGIRVEISESLFIQSQIEQRIGGAYEMPDRPGFWVDAPVAKEIARRVLGVAPSSNDRLKRGASG
jgi:hypothetical protein